MHLIKILQIIENELSTALGLVGLTDIQNVSQKILSKNFINYIICNNLQISED